MTRVVTNRLPRRFEPRARRATCAACIASAIVASASSAAFADTPAAPDPPPAAANATAAGEFAIDVGKAELLTPGAGGTVFIANPDIADVQVADANRVLIFGKKPGRTTAYILTKGGATTSYDVVVRRPTADIARAVQAAAPEAQLEVSHGAGGLLVSGEVATAAEAQAVRAAAQQGLDEKETLNFAVTVAEPVQVNLQVRVAEVSRNVTNNFGFNWNAMFNDGRFAIGLMTGREPTQLLTNSSTGVTAPVFGSFARDPTQSGLGSLGFGYHSGPVDMSALIDALQSKGLVTVLAEPNLTATSGATASFLAGGEFPVPISQGLQQISIDWKKFGVSVDFTPTVLDGNRISIRVRPEVSELSTQGAVTINNITIPAITVRRAETTVELGSGESFAIAGLFENSISKTVSQFPGLANTPVLGALFRSSSFLHDQTELVFIVTVYLVRPVAHPSELKTPTAPINFSSDLEQILRGKLTSDAPSDPGPGPHLNGSAGFMLEPQP